MTFYPSYDGELVEEKCPKCGARLRARGQSIPICPEDSEFECYWYECSNPKCNYID